MAPSSDKSGNKDGRFPFKKMPGSVPLRPKSAKANQKESPKESPLPAEENDSQTDEVEVGVDNQSTLSDTTLTLPIKNLQFLKCPECNEVNYADAVKCSKCGHGFAKRVDDSPVEKSPKRSDTGESVTYPVDVGAVIDNKYRITEKLEHFGGIFSLACESCDPDDDRALVIRMASIPPLRDTETASTEDDDQHTSVVDATIVLPVMSDTGEFKPGDTSRIDAYGQLILFERVLQQCKSSVLPTFVDRFEIDATAYIVEEAVRGEPLLDAWLNPELPTVDKYCWLESIREMLAKLHELEVIFPGMQLSRFVVSSTTGKVRLRSPVGIQSLPIANPESVFFTYYTAPEIQNDPRRAGRQSDVYSFGAIVYALSQGRELNSQDFESLGKPNSIVNTLMHEPPTLFRLLGKTFEPDRDKRFPLPQRRNDDPDGMNEVGETLAEHIQALGATGFEIAGWTTPGMNRQKNEDCFTVSNLIAGAKSDRNCVTLACLADGVGGHHGGDIASAAAVASVSDYFRSNGLSSALMRELGPDHPLSDINQCAQLLHDAVVEANSTVRELADADPDKSKMACTIEAVLLVNRQAAVAHVGDSRVYHCRGSEIRQVTSDQTLVNQLVELGEITREQAKKHPRRSELIQAVGTHEEIRPAQYILDLRLNDWVLVCTDGLTAHVKDHEIGRVLSMSKSCEAAVRYLMNLANSRGGTDNCTVVVAKVR